MPLTIANFKPSAPCSCRVCKDMCNRACWPTPDEAAALIDAGYIDKLMLDVWVGGFDGDYKDCYIVCPATPGHAGGWAPGLGPDASFADFFGYGLQNGCVMQTSKGLCSLHDKGLKPIEGRVAHHGKDSVNLHEAVARTWNNDKGRAVVRRFCEAQGLTID